MRCSALAPVVAALIAGCGGSGAAPSLPRAAEGAASAHAAETVLYSFTGGTDGGGPNGGLVFDSSGNAFGTTHFGGNDSCGGSVGGGCGVVFELSPNKSGGWTETPLYTFDDGSDGGFPNAGVILDKNGNAFGTASTGGSTQCSIGCGVVYELSKSSGWTESVLHSFIESDGEFPNAVLLPARAARSTARRGTAEAAATARSSRSRRAQRLDGTRVVRLRRNDRRQRAGRRRDRRPCRQPLRHYL